MRDVMLQRFARASGLVVILTALATPLFAQFQTGNLYGTATTTDGEPLEGVSLEISGIGAPREQTTDKEGQFRFLGLEPGNYKMIAKLEGYALVEYQPITIFVGRNTSIQLQMSPVPSESIVVTAEPPLLDASKFAPGISVSRTELEVIPTPRDPWSIADQAPGVLMSGVNVGGSESAQQLAFVGPGASRADNVFAIDGVDITDMAAIGTSSTYYDFDQFDEMHISIGGSDATVANSGVKINMVTKRGSNQGRGSARVLWSDSSLQSSSSLDADEVPPDQEKIMAPRVDSHTEYGAEGGGPILLDRLWAWGSFGLTDIRAINGVGQPDRTELEGFGAKINGQLGGSNSIVASVSRHEKRRDGRGSGPGRAPETVWRQSGPFQLIKIEDTHLFHPGFYMSALVSATDTDFMLLPKAGRDAEVLLDEDGVWRGTFVDLELERDSAQARLEGSAFFDLAGNSHQLDFGASHREFTSLAIENWGARNLIHIAGENFGTPFDLVEAMRESKSHVIQEYSAVWLQDSLKLKSWTFDVGVRYDLQRGRSAALQVDPNPVFSDLLPGISVDERQANFEWQTVSPRLGLTYNVRGAPDSVAHASYSRFPSQLHTEIIDRVNPLYGSSALYGFDDVNGNSLLDPAEQSFLLSTYGIDPDNPAAATSPNITDPDLQPPITDEILLGIKHQPRPDLVLGLDLTYREVADVLESRALVRDASGQIRPAERGDYALDSFFSGSLPNGTDFSVPVYSLDPGLEYTGGALLTNGDRLQSYRGATFHVTKRPSQRWTLRSHLTVGDWKWKIGSEFRSFDDPTDLAPGAGNESFVDTADTEREIVAEQVLPFGEKEGFFLNSSWSFDVSGIYQVALERPWGFNVAARLSGREGFPIPYYVRVTPADGRGRKVQVTSRTDAFRYDDVYTVDLRLEKEIAFGRFSTLLSVDGFNLLNSSTILQRSRQLNSGQADFIRESLSPRIFRLGVRLRWQ